MNTYLLVETNKGVSLNELSQHSKVMLVFLRHFGCTFCREAMADLNQKIREIEASNTTLVLVHQTSDTYAREILAIYDLENMHRISDPYLELYHAMGLGKGHLRQLFGLKVWFRGFWAGIVKGHLIGTEKGDVWQMPGIFILHKGKVLNSFIHEYASDRPDYVELVSCNLQNA